MRCGACAPVACRVRWAGMPVATVEAARGETDWVAADATVGGADVGAKAVTQKFPEKKPRAYATRRFGADVGDEPSRTHTRDVTFGRSVLWFGCDVPSETYPEGMVSACGEAVRVRVYDRSAPPAPDPFPVASPTEADGEKASDVTVTGEDEDGTKNENANENDDAEWTKRPKRLARQATRVALPRVPGCGIRRVRLRVLRRASHGAAIKRADRNATRVRVNGGAARALRHVQVGRCELAHAPRPVPRGGVHRDAHGGDGRAPAREGSA